MKHYKQVAIGGTFDHLHKGQKKLIDSAFARGEKVTIGLSTEEVYKDKDLSESIQPYYLRKKNLQNYLKEKKYLSRAKIVPLVDFGGPATKDTQLEALVVTAETVQNAAKINSERLRNNLTPLDIIKVPLIKGDDLQIIRSERIRLGEIDEEGRSYFRFLSKKSIFHMPESLRSQLQKPLGPVVTINQLIVTLTENYPSVVISVGDVITKALLQKKVVPSIQIIDDKKQRKLIPAKYRLARLSNPIKARNVPGTISRASVKAFIKAIDLFFSTKKPQQIVIDGEEDLTALAAILLSPLNSQVVYGQPGEGVVAVIVDEIAKDKIKHILQKFK